MFRLAHVCPACNTINVWWYGAKLGDTIKCRGSTCRKILRLVREGGIRAQKLPMPADNHQVDETSKGCIAVTLRIAWRGTGLITGTIGRLFRIAIVTLAFMLKV